MNELCIDVSVSRRLNSFWRFGVNSCHAPLLLRGGLLDHLARERRELGFGYLRCHGIFSDEMEVVAEDGTFCFDNIFRAVDNLRSIGMMPFFELSDMPGVLARGTASVCEYGFRTDPPRDFGQWGKLVGALVAALVERYGLEAVAEWYFEVWNEPDIAFWNGTRAEYFRLYDTARRAVKAVSPRLRVGGPATSKTAWIPEFLEHVSKASADDPGAGPRVDFVSTHAYPSDLPFLNAAHGEVKLQSAGILGTLFDRVRGEVDRWIGPECPVLIGEWNSSAGPLAWNHDECNNAPFVAKTMAMLRDCCFGSMYWCASDIYEECGVHQEPFYGGWGLLTVDGLPKASFHAFRFLAALTGCEVSVMFSEGAPEAVGALAATDGTRTRVLVWNYRDPDGAEPETFRFRAGGRGSAEFVLPGRGSAYESFLKMGCPSRCTPEELAELRRASEPFRIVFDAQTQLELPGGTLCLLEFDH